MSTVPSAFLIQPSKYGTTSWPLTNFVDGSSVGSCRASPAATPASVTPITTASAHLFIGHLFSVGDALLVLGFVDVEQAHPREAHLVDRPLAVADPIARVRVVLVRRRIVVPGGDVNDRPCRQNRRDLVGVRVRDVPAELIVAHAAEGLGARGGRARGIGADVRVNPLQA